MSYETVNKITDINDAVQIDGLTQPDENTNNDAIFYIKCTSCPNRYTAEEMEIYTKTGKPFKNCPKCRENVIQEEEKIKKNERNRKSYANKTPSEKKELMEKQKVYEKKCKVSQTKLRREWKQRRRQVEENRLEDNAKLKEYRIKNIDKFKEKEKKYRDVHKEEISKKQKEYKALNREELLERRRQYRLEHKEETNARQNELRKIRMAKLAETNPKKKTKQQIKLEEIEQAKKELENIDPLHERNCQRCGRTYTEEQFGINPTNFTYYKNCVNCRDAQKISDKKRADKKLNKIIVN